jgi:YHS domain-containing protein
MDSNNFPKTVCGGALREPSKFPSAVYGNEIVYFCTRACLCAFEKDPEKFMAGEIEHPLEDDELEENNI